MPSLLIYSLLIALLTAGCGSVPETRFYTINRIVPPAGSTAQRSGLIVGVRDFEADGLYARDNLLYRSGTFEILPDYYRRWAIPPQKMLGDATLEYLRGAGLFSQMIRMPSMTRTDLLLAGRIIRFEEIAAADGKSSSARLDLAFSLLDPQNLTELWRKEFSAAAPVAAPRTAESIVAAMEKALADCLQQSAASLAADLPTLNQTAR
jgi:ABC-type uncharacterized transport system auxiliary subunit